MSYRLSLCLLGLMCLPIWARAGTVIINGFGGVPLITHVTSMQGLKFQSVVPQRTDYSCGAAALATLADYAYGRHLTENQVIVGMLKVSNRKVVQQKGFSMLDMARYVTQLGLHGAGYKVPPALLTKLRVPVVVLLDIQGYEHFVVLKGVVNGRAYLADPALGNRSLSMRRFVKDWDDVVFIVMGPHYDSRTPLREGLRAVRVHGLMTDVERDETRNLREFGVIPATNF
ncbi:C39 family peptidase [Acidiferrobacter sp.]|uniref:C39 family peptidase n=1 Tax=Acidiferrobacter sp. TaxID=1872107 RepID=UPI0026121376|nr:C39 family peptidase [Acidiferrobacter sp.]